MKDFFADYPFSPAEKELLKASLHRTLAKHGLDTTLRLYPHYADYLTHVNKQNVLPVA